MLKIYDKAQWHIDAGESSEVVISKFKAIFAFLASKELLQSEGKEMIELGIDGSISLHERMITDIGKKFLDVCYDKVMDKSTDEIVHALEQEYQLFMS